MANHGVLRLETLRSLMVAHAGVVGPQHRLGEVQANGRDGGVT
jgi:hypothetical protein